MPRIVAYAREKGVGLHLWVHWRALYPKLEEAFALYEKWGVRGLMIDFMDRDDQEMIRIQEEFLQAARAINCSCSFTVRASLPA